MKIVRVPAAASLSLALVLTLGACSSDESVEAKPTPASIEAPTEDAPTEEGAEGKDVAGVAESCEEFNTLSADLRAVEPGDTAGYDDIYLRATEDKTAAPNQELADVFNVVSLLALEAGSGDDTTKTIQTLGDAVFRAAGTCTAEGVTLTIS